MYDDLGLCNKNVVQSSLEYRHLVGYTVFYLINLSAFYFVVYRTTVLAADQKNYNSSLGTNNSDYYKVSISNCISSGYRDFWGYLIIQVLSGFGNAKD